MKVRAVIFDLDETLIEEETSNDASALAAGEIAHARRGVDRVALLAALRKRSRELFLAGPLIDYCRDIGISAREALWGSFTGDDPSLVQLRQWMPTYRLQSWSGALTESGIDDRALAAELVEFFAIDRSRRHVVFRRVGADPASLEEKFPARVDHQRRARYPGHQNRRFEARQLFRHDRHLRRSWIRKTRPQDFSVGVATAAKSRRTKR